MATTDLEVGRPLSAVDIRTQVNLIQEVMKSVMRDGEHYGVIPGCQKPSLWKPGAEKLLMTFHIASEPIVEDLSTPDEVRYRVTRRGKTAQGTFVGAGIGECSSSEEKYKWRSAVCDAEYEATVESHRRLKFYKDGNTRKQVRTSPADMANTVLKMADKRAYVGLALNVTAASDIFTQDIEDLPEGFQHEERTATPTPTAPKRASESKKVNTADAESIEFVPAEVTVKEGTNKSGKPYKKLGIKGPDGWYSTFDTGYQVTAEQAKEAGALVRVTYTVDGQFKNITGLEVV